MAGGSIKDNMDWVKAQKRKRHVKVGALGYKEYEAKVFEKIKDLRNRKSKVELLEYIVFLASRETNVWFDQDGMLRSRGINGNGKGIFVFTFIWVLYHYRLTAFDLIFRIKDAFGEEVTDQKIIDILHEELVSYINFGLEKGKSHENCIAIFFHTCIIKETWLFMTAKIETTDEILNRRRNKKVEVEEKHILPIKNNVINLLDYKNRKKTG